MGNKVVIAYLVKTLDDGRVEITNSLGKSVASSDYKELTDFLYTPYKEIDGRELKVFYNLDDSVSQIFRLMPHELCKKMLKKSFKATLEDNDPYYYHDGHNFIIFGNHVVGKHNYRAHFYSLDNLIDLGHEPADVNEIYELAMRLLKAFNNIGISFPLTLNSMIGIFESSMGSMRLTPTTTFIPNEHIDLLTYAKITSKRQGWVTNYKVGNFDNPFSADLSGAYGFWLSKIRNFNKCEITRYTKDYKYKNEVWTCLETGDVTGWFKTELTINPEVKVHPFGYRDETSGRMIYKTGTLPNYYMTLEEIVYVYRHKIGTVNIIDGFYVKFLSRGEPMDKWVNDLFNKRQLGEVENVCCKSLIVEYVGKTLTEYGDDGTSKLFNPLIASWIYARCRLQVFDFIIHNELQNDVVAITTDGVLSTKPALKTQFSDKKTLGTWRVNKQSPALVLSPGWVITNDKQPHKFDYETATRLMREQPNNNFYALEYDAITSLYRSIEIDEDIRTVGKIYKQQSTIDLLELRYIQNKEYKEFPMNGKDILSNKIYQ